MKPTSPAPTERACQYAMRRRQRAAPERQASHGLSGLSVSGHTRRQFNLKRPIPAAGTERWLGTRARPSQKDLVRTPRRGDARRRPAELQGWKSAVGPTPKRMSPVHDGLPAAPVQSIVRLQPIGSGASILPLLDALLRPTRLAHRGQCPSAPVNRREDVAHLHAGENHSRCLRSVKDRTREETWQEARRQSGIQKAERRHIQMVSRRTASLFSSSDVRGFCDGFQFERRGSGAPRESSGPSAARLGPEPTGPTPPHSGPHRRLLDARRRPAGARCLSPTP